MSLRDMLRRLVRLEGDPERVRMDPYQGGGAWSDAAVWDAVYELDLRAGRLSAEAPFIKIYELRSVLDRHGVETPTDVLVAGWHHVARGSAELLGAPRHRH